VQFQFWTAGKLPSIAVASLIVSGFPASISVLFLNIKTPVTEISSPEAISSHSIVTKSAIGPKKNHAKGHHKA